MYVSAVTPSQGQVRRRALFLSSLNATRPMGYYAQGIISSLDHAGYGVTYMADGAVTIDFLLTQMKNYSVVIWRTDGFAQKNATYWYISDNPTAAEKKYASNFAEGQLTTSAGMIAASTDFFANHLGRDSLRGVKLMIFVASNGKVVAPIFLRAGVQAVVFTNGAITFQFGLVDDLTAQFVGFLTQGDTVYNAVYDTISPINQGEPLWDPLGSAYGIFFWYLGDGTVTIVPSIQSAPALRGHRLP